jgi:hypothetical protein
MGKGKGKEKEVDRGEFSIYPQSKRLTRCQHAKLVLLCAQFAIAFLIPSKVGLEYLAEHQVTMGTPEYMEVYYMYLSLLGRSNPTYPGHISKAIWGVLLSPYNLLLRWMYIAWPYSI